MAWTPKNPTGKCPMKEETIAALGNAATVYTSVIDFIDPILRNGQTTKYLVFTFQPADAPASGDYEIILYGAKKSGGSDKYCSFTSCVRPSGEYSNTLVHYLCGNNMLPFFITEVDKDKKIGRCCMYLSNDIVATGRYFGSMFDSDSLIARDKVQEALGGTWVVKGVIDNKYICNDSTGYVDFGYGVVTVRKDADFEKIYIENGICLACGEELDTSKDLICNDCSEAENDYTTCSDCGVS